MEETTEKPRRGRPKGRKYPRHLFTAVTDDMAAELKRAAQEDGVSESSILRAALADHLAKRLHQKVAS